MADLIYSIYAGSVLPLTVQGDSCGLTATRNVELDFSNYAQPCGSGHHIQVTDAYCLTNETDTDRTVTLLYPYVGDLGGKVPTISVDGTLVRTTLNPGPYAGGFEGTWGDDGDPDGTSNLDLPASFEDYRWLLAETDYSGSAFDAFPELDLPAYVYRLHDFTGTADETVTNPVLTVTFSGEPDHS